MLGMQGSWAAGQVGNLQQMLGMQGSWAAGWQPAGVVAGCDASWQPAGVVAGCEDSCWECRDLGLQVGNLQVLWLDVRTGLQTTNAGAGGELQVGNLQVLWLDVRTGSQTTNAGDAILGCRLARLPGCGWKIPASPNVRTGSQTTRLARVDTVLGCRDLGLQVGNLQVLWLDEDWVANNKCGARRDLELQVGNLQVVAGCEEWVANKKC